MTQTKFLIVIGRNVHQNTLELHNKPYIINSTLISKMRKQ